MTRLYPATALIGVTVMLIVRLIKRLLFKPKPVEDDTQDLVDAIMGLYRGPFFEAGPIRVRSHVTPPDDDDVIVAPTV